MEEKNYFCRGAFKNSILKELDSPGWKNRWHELEIKTLQQYVTEEDLVSPRGIYVLIINKKLQYIGESENLRSRLNVHLMNMRHYLDHNIQLIIKVKCVNDSEKRKELEQMLISRIKPSGNRFRRETILKVMQRRKENESRKTLLW